MNFQIFSVNNLQLGILLRDERFLLIPKDHQFFVFLIYQKGLLLDHEPGWFEPIHLCLFVRLGQFFLETLSEIGFLEEPDQWIQFTVLKHLFDGMKVWLKPI